MILMARHLCRLTVFSLLALAPIQSRSQDVFLGCPMQGCAASPCVQELDRLKNRYNPPSPQDIDNSITLQAMLAPGDDETRWRNSQAAIIEGYVVKVDHGGCAEACNCNKAAVRDTHIEIALSLADQADETKHVIVEVTPRMREIMRQQGVDLSTETLHDRQRGIIGKKVRFTGWMLFDSMHERESFHTRNRPRSLCGTLHNPVWRATSWEIHPITRLEVIESPPLPANFVIDPLDSRPCRDKPCPGQGGRGGSTGRGRSRGGMPRQRRRTG